MARVTSEYPTSPGLHAFECAAGPYRASFVNAGAGLASLSFTGHDLVLAHGADQCPPGYMGKTLVPWPNRIRDGRYSWMGQDYELPCTDIATHTALHGLLSWTHWQLHEYTDDHCIFDVISPASYGYPWTLQSRVEYSLNADEGMKVAITTRNLSDSAAPYGTSHHPYLTAGEGSVDDWELTLPAASVMDADEQLIPIEKLPVTALDRDFREARSLRGVTIDHCFTDMPTHRAWRVDLRNPATGLTTHLHSGAPWVQAYTGDAFGRLGIAVEPMTCPPDAFNTGQDVIALAPGATHRFSYRISASGI